VCDMMVPWCVQVLYPSYFKLPMRWLPLLTPVTYLSKLLGIRSVAALQGYK
jgi:hypothetical protein